MIKRCFYIILSLLLVISMSACHSETDVDPSDDFDAGMGDITSKPDDGDQSFEPEPDPEPEEARVSFFATGDNLIHTGIWRQANRNVGGSGNDCKMDSPYDFKPFYNNIADWIASADIAFLNQETLVAADVSSGPKNYPTFNTPAACGDAMIDLGFDVVNIANNHMLDMGSSGLKNSIEYWREKESVVQIGGYLDEDDYNKVRVIECGDIRVAFLAYVEDANNSGRGLGTPISNYHNYSSLGLYVPAMNEAELRRQVGIAKQNADFVVVAFHWGIENADYLSQVQMDFTDICCELGVDVVLGSHPHVLQPMKWANGNTSSGKTLVVNSLGNMISLMETTESNLLGGALSLDFVKVGDETWVENVVLRPFVTHCSSNYRQIALYPLKDYTADLYRTHYIHSHCKTTLDDFYKNVCKNVPREFWGSEDYTIS